MKNKISNIVIVAGILLLISCNLDKINQDLQVTNNKILTLKDSLAPDGRIALIAVSSEIRDGQILVSGETTEADFHTSLSEFMADNSISWIDSVKVLPDETLNNQSRGLVTLSVANLRSHARHSAEMATQAIMGTPLKIFKKSGGWLYVQTPDKYLAWTNTAAVQTMNNVKMDEWRKSDRVIYLKDFGIVFSQQSTESTPVSDIVMGSILQYDLKTSAFFHVLLPDGRSGYLPIDECQDFSNWKSTVSPEFESLKAVGLQMLGRPYLWGGTSTKGLDCSGFVKTMYFMNGLVLSRDASQQVHQGEAVNTEKGFDSLQPGDLLFFGRKATAEKSERVTHVGMYLSNGKFIHSSGRVKINSFNKEDSDYLQYLIDIFVKSRRIMNIDPDNAPVSVSQHPWY